MPLISVVMPAYNAESTLAESLNSLALQSFRDFEVVLVDDGSNDRTLEIATQFSSFVSMRLLVNSQNLGVAASLNRGIAECDSTFVARLDSDDLAHPERLLKQLEFLNANVQVDLCGSNMPMFRSVESGPFSILSQPVTDAAIKTTLVHRNSLSHPSIMARRSFFNDVGNYNSDRDYAEDYDLWCRGALLGKQYANLEAHLTSYRVHPGQIGQSKSQLQCARDLDVKRSYITTLLGEMHHAYLPELFSSLVKFTSKDVATMVLAESSAALIALGNIIWDPIVYATIVRDSIYRHLK